MTAVLDKINFDGYYAFSLLCAPFNPDELPIMDEVETKDMEPEIITKWLWEVRYGSI